MKTIIAGSRSIDYLENIDEIIKQSGFQITEVVCGKAKGADSLGEDWANSKGIPVIPFSAKWDDLSHSDAIIKENRYGKYDAKAGMRRNQEMAEYAETCIVLWDGESPGSKNMIELAIKEGLEVFVYNLATEEGEHR